MKSDALNALPGLAILMLDMARDSLERAVEAKTLDQALPYIDKAKEQIGQIIATAREAVHERDSQKDATLEHRPPDLGLE